MAMIELSGVHKSFGTVDVIKGVDIRIEDGEFAVFVGPSGCGKSTLLRMIAGLETMTTGELSIDGKRMNDVAPDQRGIAMVFQSYALYPHMTVAQNIGFSLDLKKVPKAEIAAEVAEVAEKLQLTPLLERRPGALSGGQRQRVAIGRAIIKKPSVILFDEPLSNLDASLRVQMRAELQRLHRELGSTIVYVTHDQVEAMTMADRIVVLKDGEVMQAAKPIDLYKKPENTFVAGFIGSPRMNLLTAVVQSQTGGPLIACTNAGWKFDLPAGQKFVAGATVRVGVRPEHLKIADGANCIEGKISLIERLGAETYLTIDHAGEPVIARLDGDADVGIDEDIKLGIQENCTHIFDESGNTLGA